MAEPLIEVTDLAKVYARRDAVAGLTLQVRPGEVCALLGANGGGKTTALRMLAGLLKPDRGSGVVLGCDLRGSLKALRRRVGYLSQHFSLYGELSVAENLRFRAEVYGLAKPRQAVERVLTEFGLERFARTPAGRLSGGWMNRLQFAGALIHAPRLLLLDEPTAGLDVLMKARTWTGIYDLAARGVGVVISTHDLAEVQDCAQVLVFADGAVLAQGAPAELARQTLGDAAPAPGSADVPMARVAAALLAGRAADAQA